MRVIDSLFSGHTVNGDGSSIKKAIIVDSIEEEYQWIQQNCAGFKHQMQSLERIKSKSYDVHLLISNEGEKRTVYFDISRFYGKS